MDCLPFSFPKKDFQSTNIEDTLMTINFYNYADIREKDRMKIEMDCPRRAVR